MVAVFILYLDGISSMFITMGRFFLFFCFFLSSSTILFSQRSFSYSTDEKEYNIALELFQKEKYGSAQKHFQNLIEDLQGFDTELLINAEHYSALCSVYLFNDDSEYRLNRFISDHPESMKARKAVWEMALFLYKTKKYRQASGYFERVDRGMLVKEELAEYYFKKGYCYFIKKDFDKASLAFYEIKDIQSDYTGPAIYYYSYINYSKKNFETALIGFKRLENDATFKGIVPYYILQILYSQKKYEEIIEFGPGLLEKSIPGRMAEVARFVGDAYYQLEKYEEAQKYLTIYVENLKSISRQDKYQMGFMYHKLGNYEKAINYFESIGGRKDELGQNAYYLLADCYLRTDNKSKAAIAFFNASDMNIDPDISEDALLNYAKITYELSFSPFNEAIKAFEKFINLYPYSERIDEAYQYLVMAFQNTRNYKQALESLNKIQNKNNRIKEAYQRIAFYRGLEQYSDLKFEDALDLFNTSLEQGDYDQTLIARCLYWKAESLYRLGEYKEALTIYQEFLISPRAFSQYEFNLAHYNIGYCHFDLEQYSNASRDFRKYIDVVKKGGNKKILADTYNRLGDCAFVLSDYSLAISYYQKSVDLKAVDSDYALFQKSFSLGLLKRHMDEIIGLTSLQREYPSSNYVDDALFERGRSYVKIENLQKALDDFYSILEHFPNSTYYPKAMLEIGLVYYNMDNNAKAIESYKKLIAEFPGSPESRSALTGLRTVYVDLNDVESYFGYVRTLGSFASVSISEQDSLTYLSGENLYMSGNCQRAVQVLGNYLERFKDGSFVLNARFYRAECLSSSGNTREALEDYNYVIDRKKNVFSEPSLLAASMINFQVKNYADALENYVLLEIVADVGTSKLIALMGQLRCLYILQDYSGVVKAGEKVLVSGKLSEEQTREAYFKMGKSYLFLGNPDEAKKVFRKVAGEIKSEEGAESKYRIAEICYQSGKLDEAEREVTEFIDQNTPHQHWMARIFILSSDISLEKNDLFQARYTLQSLIDYYEIEDDGVKEEARRKLNRILEIEQVEEDINEPDSVYQNSDQELMSDILNNYNNITQNFYIQNHHALG